MLFRSLEKSVTNDGEHGMVRHESAMAFGELENERSMEMLRSYAENEKLADNDILKESCVVALNMVEDTDAWLKQQFAL